MAANNATSCGVAIPRQCGGVPAGDQVCAAEALTPAVQMVRGAWGTTRAHISLPAANLTQPCPGIAPSQPGSLLWAAVNTLLWFVTN